MNNETTKIRQLHGTGEVAVKSKKGISIIWLLPLVALLVAGWLGYKTYSEKGPVITISFQNAAGIEAGKTKVKHKEVTLGLVSDVTLSKDFKTVDVTVHFNKEAKHHLTENTQFWVVRPKVGISGVTGLSTLFSGSYIEYEPGTGEAAKSFIGLEEPPVIHTDTKGRKFILRTDQLGSLHKGAPIYFRGIRAGEILGYKFLPDSSEIQLHAFVEAPFHNLVKTNTRFWNVSGMEMQVGAEGIKVETGSLQTFLSGGIAFDTDEHHTVGNELASENASFTLFDRFSETKEVAYAEKLPYTMFFQGSVRGLSVGAPVEFRGIKLGSVTDIDVIENPNTLDIFIPVTMEIEPERIPYLNGDNKKRTAQEVLAELINRGLKAQLQTGSLLTGQLFVDLEFHPDVKTSLANIELEHPQFPTIPTTIAQVKETVSHLVTDLQKLPLAEIAQNLVETTNGLNRLVNDPDMKNTIHSTNATLVQAEKTLASMNTTLATVDDVIAPDSPLQYDLANMMVEFKAAAHSFRMLTNYLERHPESLISGKK